MNVTGLIFLGAGYLIGNPAAREKFTTTLQQLAGQSIDALNKLGGDRVALQKSLLQRIAIWCDQSGEGRN